MSISSRGPVLMLLIGVGACGRPAESPPSEPTTTRPIERPEVGVDRAPLAGPFVFLVHHDALLEPVMCCADGRCRAEQCDLMMGDAASVEDDAGTVLTIGAAMEIDCVSRGRTVWRVSPAASVKPAIWPASMREHLWWRGPVTFHDTSQLSEEERAQLGAVGAAAAAVDIVTLDLDGDEHPEQLVAVDGDGGGVFLRRRGDRGPALVSLLQTTSPRLLGAMDLDGDRVRELLVLDGAVTPADFVALDIVARTERLRTRWICTAPRRYFDHGPAGIETDPTPGR